MFLVLVIFIPGLLSAELLTVMAASNYNSDISVMSNMSDVNDINDMDYVNNTDVMSEVDDFSNIDGMDGVNDMSDMNDIDDFSDIDDLSDIDDMRDMDGISDMSDWFYIKLTAANPYQSCQDDYNPSLDILENLSQKLHVNQNMFVITSLDTLSAGIISTNLSLVHPLPELHTSLSTLQLTSPEFNVCGQQFSLALILHQNNHLLNMKGVRIFLPS